MLNWIWESSSAVLPVALNFDLNQYCWSCAKKDKKFTENPEIVKQYPLAFRYETDCDIFELQFAENPVEAVLQKRGKPNRMKHYLHQIRPLGKRRIQFVFLACVQCKNEIKNSDTFFVKKGAQAVLTVAPAPAIIIPVKKNNDVRWADVVSTKTNIYSHPLKRKN